MESGLRWFASSTHPTIEADQDPIYVSSTLFLDVARGLCMKSKT